MKKEIQTCELCVFSSTFSCIGKNNQIVNLKKEKEYDNKLFNLLKKRVSCGRLLEENSISDSCQFFKRRE